MKINLERGLLNNNYNQENLSKIYNINDYKNSLNIIENKISLSYNNYLEISDEYSPAFIFLLEKFKEGNFLSENDFYSMLTYHSAIINNKNLYVYNYNFNSLHNIKWTEKFDFIFSFIGIKYKDLFEKLPLFISFLKVNGFLAFIIPSYWFDRENLNESESLILEYSRKTDKQWLFTESIDNIVKENKAEIVSLEKINMVYNFSRIKIARLSSLEKLYNACLEKNHAILDICNIPEENLNLNLSVLIINKKTKSITKDNLFNI
ncbi:MAG TPA: hypothetical protein PLE45_02555 [Spirochaetota bacterium]|nr:hypothetical protein [Spirochaetota bacterium]HOL57851.1 hypothetical protein [Spirochaetota bacterium]